MPKADMLHKKLIIADWPFFRNDFSLSAEKLLHIETSCQQQTFREKPHELKTYAIDINMLDVDQTVKRSLRMLEARESSPRISKT